MPVKRNVAASWLAHGTALALGFFLMPYVIGVLGVRQYGDWVFINSFVVYAGLLYLGFGETVARFVAKHQAEGQPERVNQVVSLVLAIYAVTGTAALIAAGVLCWLSPWFGTWTGERLLQIRIVILLLGMNFAVGMCGSVFGGVLLGLRRFDVERAVTIASDFVRFGLIYFLLRAEWGCPSSPRFTCSSRRSSRSCWPCLRIGVFPQLRVGPRW